MSCRPPYASGWTSPNSATRAPRARLSFRNGWLNHSAFRRPVPSSTRTSYRVMRRARRSPATATVPVTATFIPARRSAMRTNCVRSS